MTTPTLTDRYVFAVVRSVPEAERAEIDAEVRLLIGDLLDERTAGAEPTPDDERQVLSELGDPAQLAARYRTQQRVLIGHVLYPAYVRTLRLVLSIAVPAITALTLIATLSGDDVNAASVVGAVVGTPFMVAVQVSFWVTVGFACVERFGSGESWTIDRLPAASEVRSEPSKTSFLADVGASVAGTVAAAVALVWQHVDSPLVEEGVAIPILHPDLFGVIGWVLVAIWAASSVVGLLAMRARRWTISTAVANGVLNLASFGVIAALAMSERLVNPEAAAVISERVGADSTWLPNPMTIVIVVAAIELWDTIDVALKARRTHT